MTEKVKVILTGYERVQYHQYREIDRAVWDKYLALVASDASARAFEDMAELLIDRADVVEGEGIEDFQIEIDSEDEEEEGDA